MQVGRTSRVYHSTHKCYFSIHNLCILAYLGKRGEEGGKLGQMYFNFDAAFKYIEDEEEV